MNKILLTVGITLAVIAANVNAQTMIAGGVDTVTVGSQMPYSVTPDPNIESMVGSGWLDPSQFDWQIASGSGTINTSNLSIYYPDSILVTWGGKYR